MADKRAGSIVASSFVAGLLLTAGIFAPRAWEPVPEPFFGLEEPGMETAAEQRPAVVQQPARTPVQPPAAPFERLAMGPGNSAAGIAAAAQALPALARTTTPPAASPPQVAVQISPPVANQSPNMTPQSSPGTTANGQDQGSLRALVVRVQTARPGPQEPTAAASNLPRRISPPPVVEPLETRVSPPGAEQLAQVPHELLGAPPLPGAEWVDPDSVNWSAAPPGYAAPKPAEALAPRLGLRGPAVSGLLGDRRVEVGAGLRSRLRVGERLLGRDRVAIADAAGGPSATLPLREPSSDINSWPAAVKLSQQFEQLATSAASADHAATGPWAAEALGRLRGMLATAGPRDAAAENALMTLGESVHAGMGIADATTDQAHAAATRRAALSLARRVAVWRAATGLCAVINEAAAGGAAAPPPTDAAAHATLQTATARLLDALERFESSLAPADAATAAAALAVIESSAHTGAQGVVKSVRDHYLSANVRIAMHQQFLEKMLPETTVNTGPVDEFVMGRKVRGTRTVERSTTLRFTPDSDEICFDLEIHGDVASRTVTDAAGVSLTSHGDSSFTVHKPIKICLEGLLFGAAAGVASNRTQLANVQTSFDSVPIMRSLVRNIVRNQHDESLPQANREVIDRIITTACREVDAQSEPQFAELAERIRERVWSPMVRLGLEPTPVAMETTPTVATLRLRLAGDGQLAAHTPRPRAPTDTMLSLQVHDSTINNALERLEIGGRRLSLEELICLMSERMGVESRVPDDLPEGVKVTFAKVQPLRVECRDGLVHVRVALDAIESGRRNWYDIVAHVAYKPTAVAPQVFLDREGPVQLSGPGHQGRVEFALRTIFSKTFPKERPIPLLPEKMTANPRLAGMHVLQAVSTDGWFSLAMGLREPALTATAQPAKTAAQPRKTFFK
ncbi:MAG: hypothetical protein WCH77_05005 [Planctomycetota bacterium]